MAREAVLRRGRPALATAAAAGLELAWLYALLHTAGGGLHLRVSVPPLLLMYVVSFGLTLGLRALGRSARMTTLLSWTTWPFVTFLLLVAMLHGFGAISGEVWAAVFVVLAAGVLWWFGGHLAGGRVTYQNLLARFQIGLLLMVCSLLIGYLLHVSQKAAIPAAVVFVGLGLGGAAVARSEDKSGPRLRRRGGTWWGMLVISLVVVFILGLVAGVIFTPGPMKVVARGFHGLWKLIERGATDFAGLFPSSCAENPASKVTPGGDVLNGTNSGGGVSLEPPRWLASHVWGAIFFGILFGAMVLLFGWWMISQLLDRMRRRGDGDVQIESLAGAFRLDLAALFRRILALLANLPLIGRRSRHKEEPSRTTSVRRLYADMLRWGAEAGLPRAASQTPFEYQETLCTALPAQGVDVTFITKSYVKAKYGARPPSEAELHELKESRRRLKRRTARPAVSTATDRPADRPEDHDNTRR